MRDISLRSEIVKTLMFFKIPTELVGYDFLKEGIYLCITDPTLLDGYTKNLYPVLAEKFDSNSLVVERNIRSAINSCYNSGGMLGFNEVFGRVVYDNSEKLTNSEFISMMVEIVRLNMMKKEYKRQLLHEGDVPALHEEGEEVQEKQNFSAYEQQFEEGVYDCERGMVETCDDIGQDLQEELVAIE